MCNRDTVLGYLVVRRNVKCVLGNMDGMLGLDAVVVPTSAREEGTVLMVKYKGRCIILFPGDVSDVLHNPATANSACVSGSDVRQAGQVCCCQPSGVEIGGVF